MRLSRIKSPEHRARYVAKLRKSLLRRLGKKRVTRPVFIGGMQRSGTTMLMNVFHLRGDTDVFDEAKRSAVFDEFRLRDTDVVRESLRKSRSAIAVYKVICDSHLLLELLNEFPDALAIWMYREAPTNAESQLRKFANPVGAIKLVRDGEPGGGWFAEGLDEEAADTIRRFRDRDLSDFDWACLNWWARNKLYFDQQLAGHDRVRLLRYEELVTRPHEELASIVSWLDLPADERSVRFVHSRSAVKPGLPELDPDVRDLCDSLLAALDDANRRSDRDRN